MIVCTVLVLDTFVRPVFFCALVRFRFFIFPCSLHIDDLSCNDRFTTRTYVLFLLPAGNIDDPFASKKKREWAQARVKGDDLWRTEITVRPIALESFTNSRQERIL